MSQPPRKKLAPTTVLTHPLMSERNTGIEVDGNRPIFRFRTPLYPTVATGDWQALDSDSSAAFRAARNC